MHLVCAHIKKKAFKRLFCIKLMYVRINECCLLTALHLLATDQVIPHSRRCLRTPALAQDSWRPAAALQWAAQARMAVQSPLIELSAPRFWPRRCRSTTATAPCTLAGSSWRASGCATMCPRLRAAWPRRCRRCSRRPRPTSKRARRRRARSGTCTRRGSGWWHALFA